MAGRAIHRQRFRRGSLRGCSVFLSAVVACVLLPGIADSAEAAPLTVERLVAEPFITGTAPASPGWSADSQWLAFLWNDAARSNRQLWIADRNGGPPERLTADDGSTVSEFAWTPDSRAIVFLRNGDLWQLELADRRLRQLSRDGGNKSVLRLSPDGKPGNLPCRR